MDDDAAWLCTQAVLSADDDDPLSGDCEEKANGFGCIVLHIEADSESYVLQEGDNTIGRHPLNSIYIEHPSVSMNHAVIQCDSDGVVLLDKGSLNKTKLNKKNLKKDVAYFLNGNALLMFGDVCANYYVDGEPCKTLNACSNGITEQKIFKNNGDNGVNENNSTCTMATIVPKTIIEPGCVKNTSSDMHLESNSSSPSDKLLLEIVSQIEIMENTDLTRVVHNISREDTPSPVMNLTESFSLRPNNNTLQFSRNHITTRRNYETASVSDSLSDQFLNSYKTLANCSQPNKINTEVTREDTPSPVMDLGLFDESESRLSISETNRSQCLVNKCTKKYDDLEETKMLTDTIFFENSTHNMSTKTVGNTKIVPESSISLINQSNTNEINPLDECTQLPVWDNENVVNSSVLINANVGSLENLKENDSSSMKTLQVQSNDDQFINHSSQKIIPSKSSSTDVLQQFGANSSLILCKSETKDCKFNDMETQITDFDGDSSYKSSTLKLATNTCDSKNEKQDETIFEADDDDILFCVAQEVEAGEQSNKNLIDISNGKHFSDLQDLNNSANNIVKSKDSFCNKNKSYNNGTIYGPSQSVSTSKPFHIKTKSDFYKQSSFKKNGNTFEADDDDIFSSFIEQESKSQVCDKTTLINEDFFNCPTQTELILNKVNSIEKTSGTVHEEEIQVLELSKSSTANSYMSTMHNDATQFSMTDNENFLNCLKQIESFSKMVNSKISSTTHDKETQLLSPSKKISTSKVCVTGLSEDETQIPDNDFFKILTHDNKIDTTISSKHEDLFQISKMDDDDFFNCSMQKVSISKNKNLKDNVSFTRYKEETEQISQNSKTGTNGVTRALKMEVQDFFNYPIQKVLVPESLNSKSRVSSTIYAEETENISPINETSKNKLETTSIHKKPPQNSELENEDFFNCPTQKILVPKSLNSKSRVSSTIHEEETENFSPLNKTSTNKLETISIREKSPRNLEIDDEDFFNCPTQKISVPKSLNSKSRVSSTIHEEETESFSPLNKTSENKLETTSIHKKPPRNLEMDDEDFFNCPTQKISVPKSLNLKSRISSTIHEEETENFSPLNKTSTNKLETTSIHKKPPRNLEIDDEDFFNCPTQKISVPKSLNSKSRVSSTIHEEETESFSPLNKTSENKLETTSIHKKPPRNLEMDDEDFFNCPTQKISVPKSLNLKSRISSTIHEEETENLSPLNKTSTNKLETINIREKSPRNLEMDNEDFFNCPTQIVSISKKTGMKGSISNFIRNEEETQNFPQHNETNINKFKTCAAIIQNKPPLSPEMDDEDFFNCPTQKLSVPKKSNSKAIVPSTIHEEETQHLPQLNKTNTNTFKTLSAVHTNKLPLNPAMDSEDFFNCPTQKASISEKTYTSVNMSNFTRNEEETQTLPQLCETNTSNCGTYEDLNRISKLTDEDFFNCPTQKVSVSKKINLKPEVSSVMHEGETQYVPEFLKPSKINKNTCNACFSNTHSDLTQVSEVIDEDFFNCPTQKISIFKSTNLEKKESSTLYEEETQTLSKLPESNKTNSSTSGMHSNFTQIAKMNNDDFFSNSPTEKVSISKKILEETQLSMQSKINAFISETCSSRILENLTQILKTNNEDFFDCSPQKIPTLKKSISSSKVSSDDKKELQKCSEISQRKEDPTVSGTCADNLHKHLTSGPEMDSDDFFNCPTHKVSTSVKFKTSVDIDKQEIVTGDINEAETQELSEQSNSSKCDLVKQKQIVEPNDNTNISKFRKSTRLDSALMKKLNAQLAAIFDEDENSSKSPKVNKKPTIRVRKDLHSPCSKNKSSKKVSRLVRNISSTSTNKNLDLPGCSKTDRPNSVKVVPVKQEPLANVSAECLPKRHSKRLDETVFSPLNVPNVSTNSMSEQHLSSAAVPINIVSSTSNDVSKWQLFWNKKKMSSQSKGNVENENKVMVKKERIQTRAITRKENSTELSRKRKQDSVDEKNKRMCKNNRSQILDTSINDTPEVVVTFSYLRNRHLQEMKYFVDKTGGFVTDEITQCTVLVTNKIRCTTKIMVAIARGCPIVDAKWLKHSYTVKEFQEVEEFIVMDKDAERKYKFRLKESLARARANRLLDGYTVLVTPSVKPGPKDMKVIITCAGGDLVLNWPKTRAQKELIVTCKQDRLQWKPVWDNDKAVMIDEETLVMSIIRQKLTI